MNSPQPGRCTSNLHNPSPDTYTAEASPDSPTIATSPFALLRSLTMGADLSTSAACAPIPTSLESPACRTRLPWRHGSAGDATRGVGGGGSSDSAARSGRWRCCELLLVVVGRGDVASEKADATDGRRCCHGSAARLPWHDATAASAVA
jgi:hypothetical protein